MIVSRNILCAAVLGLTAFSFTVHAARAGEGLEAMASDNAFLVSQRVASTPVATGEFGTTAREETLAAFGPLPVEMTHYAHVELAATPSAMEDEANDPLEGVNRAIFGFNEVIYTYVFHPVGDAYNSYVPKNVRAGVMNILDNLSAPVILVNDVLQLEFNRALVTLTRFVVNTTGGMLGIADMATEIGIAKHKEDFGQTLGSYGMGEGVYLVLPIFGPSNPRDAVGKFLVDPYFDAFGMWLSNTDRDAEAWARTGMDGLSEYASLMDELDQIKKTSVDYYAAIRSLYRQKRKAEIANGRQEDLPPIPNYNINFAPSGDSGVAGIK